MQTSVHGAGFPSTTWSQNGFPVPHPGSRCCGAARADPVTSTPKHRPRRPKVGITPRLEDAELVTVVVVQALLGFTSEARWLRCANGRLRGLFPYLPT